MKKIKNFKLDEGGKKEQLKVVKHTIPAEHTSGHLIPNSVLVRN